MESSTTQTPTAEGTHAEGGTVSDDATDVAIDTISGANADGGGSTTVSTNDGTNGDAGAGATAGAGIHTSAGTVPSKDIGIGKDAGADTNASMSTDADTGTSINASKEASTDASTNTDVDTGADTATSVAASKDAGVDANASIALDMSVGAGANADAITNVNTSTEASIDSSGAAEADADTTINTDVEKDAGAATNVSTGIDKGDGVNADASILAGVDVSTGTSTGTEAGADAGIDTNTAAGAGVDTNGSHDAEAVTSGTTAEKAGADVSSDESVTTAVSNVVDSGSNNSAIGTATASSTVGDDGSGDTAQERSASAVGDTSVVAASETDAVGSADSGTPSGAGAAVDGNVSAKANDGDFENTVAGSYSDSSKDGNEDGNRTSRKSDKDDDNEDGEEDSNKDDNDDDNGDDGKGDGNNEDNEDGNEGSENDNDDGNENGNDNEDNENDNDDNDDNDDDGKDDGNKEENENENDDEDNDDNDDDDNNNSGDDNNDDNNNGGSEDDTEGDDNDEDNDDNGDDSRSNRAEGSEDGSRDDNEEGNEDSNKDDNEEDNEDDSNNDGNGDSDDDGNKDDNDDNKAASKGDDDPSELPELPATPKLEASVPSSVHRLKCPSFREGAHSPHPPEIADTWSDTSGEESDDLFPRSKRMRTLHYCEADADPHHFSSRVFTSRVFMFIGGVPIFAQRQVRAIIAPLPIGVVALHTLYCTANEKFGDDAPHPVVPGGKYVLLGVDASSVLSNLVKLPGKRKAVFRRPKVVRTRGLRAPFLMMTPEVVGPSGYRVCRSTPTHTCKCTERMWSATVAQLCTMTVNPVYHAGKTYYVHGFARFAKARPQGVEPTPRDLFGVVVSVDGHMCVFQNNYIAAIKFFHEIHDSMADVLPFDELITDYRVHSVAALTALRHHGFDLATVESECRPVRSPDLSKTFSSILGNFSKHDDTDLDGLHKRDYPECGFDVAGSEEESLDNSAKDPGKEKQCELVIAPSQQPVPRISLLPPAAMYLAKEPKNREVLYAPQMGKVQTTSDIREVSLRFTKAEEQALWSLITPSAEVKRAVPSAVRRVNKKRIMLYRRKVTAALSNSPRLFSRFIKTVQSHLRGSITTADALARLSVLFEAYPKLAKDLPAFLDENEKLGLSRRKLRGAEGSQIVKKAGRRKQAVAPKRSSDSMSESEPELGSSPESESEDAASFSSASKPKRRRTSENSASGVSAVHDALSVSSDVKRDEHATELLGVDAEQEVAPRAAPSSLEADAAGVKSKSTGASEQERPAKRRRSDSMGTAQGETTEQSTEHASPQAVAQVESTLPRDAVNGASHQDAANDTSHQDVGEDVVPQSAGKGTLLQDAGNAAPHQGAADDAPREDVVKDVLPQGALTGTLSQNVDKDASRQDAVKNALSPSAAMDTLRPDVVTSTSQQGMTKDVPPQDVAKKPSAQSAVKDTLAQSATTSTLPNGAVKATLPQSAVVGTAHQDAVMGTLPQDGVKDTQYQDAAMTPNSAHSSTRIGEQHAGIAAHYTASPYQGHDSTLADGLELGAHAACLKSAQQQMQTLLIVQQQSQQQLQQQLQLLYQQLLSFAKWMQHQHHPQQLLALKQDLQSITEFLQHLEQQQEACEVCDAECADLLLDPPAKDAEEGHFQEKPAPAPAPASVPGDFF